MKYSFKNDYSELAHPDVLAAMSSVGNVQFDGYGQDKFSADAAGLIREMISDSSADIHFIAGGTHANLTVISSALHPFEAVIAPDSGHVCVHEAGAIEAAGHKICTVKGIDGKLCPDDIETIAAAHNDEHMVKPKLVYISQSSENGTVYKKAELTAISECCRKNDLHLYLDGARLGAAINSASCDLTYADIASLTDVFYIGGTKNGALIGEAIVICNDALKPNFRYHLKQRGALLAKGAAIGVQFKALLENGLFNELACRANAAAARLAGGINAAGYGLMYPAETNMLFPVFPGGVAQRLHELYDFYDMETNGDMVTARIVCSWATPEAIAGEFIRDLGAIRK